MSAETLHNISNASGDLTKQLMEKQHEMSSKVSYKKRSELHLTRKIWHITTVAAMAYIYSLLSDRAALLVVFGLILLFVPGDFLRQTKPEFNEWVTHAFRAIIRQNEVHKLAGTTYLLLGVFVILLLFPREVVTLALLFLAFADPIASFVGIKWGKDKIFRHKSFQGFLAAFLVCTGLSFIYFYYNNLMVDRIIAVSLIAGLSGALAELVPIGKIDDNFTLPVVSATAIWIITLVFGGLT